MPPEVEPPLLSIVTPTLNASGTLVRALRSVASQAVDSIEHIIVDGGSTDGSAELIAAHAAAHPGLVTRVIIGPDRGQSDALNKGFEAARGEWGGWINADDWYEPGALAAVSRTLRADREVDLLIGRCRFVDGSGREVFRPEPPDPVSLASLLKLKSLWFNGRSLAQPEVFFRLSLLRRIGGLNVENHYSMDHELWLRLLESGARVGVIDDALACIGVHAGQKTADNRAVVRSLLVSSEACVERSAGALGDELAAVRGELASMRRKLSLVDAAMDWFGPAGQGVDGVAAAGVYDDAAGAGAGLSEAQRELCDPATARALTLGLGRVLGGKPLRVLVLARDAGVLPEVIEGLRGRAFGLSFCAPGASVVERVSGAMSPEGPRHRFAGARLESGLIGPPRPGESFDLMVTEFVLVCFSDFESAARSLWSWLAPGGVWVQLAEPRPCDAIGPYVESLKRRLSAQLSRDDEIVLDAGADGSLRRAAEERAGRGASWTDAHPGRWGVDVERVMGAAGATALGRCAFGSLAHHPITPFPFVGGREPAGSGTWITSVWQRPRGSGPVQP